MAWLFHFMILSTLLDYLFSIWISDSARFSITSPFLGYFHQFTKIHCVMARVALVLQEVISCKKSIVFLLVAVNYFGWTSWSAGSVLVWSVWPMYKVCGYSVGASSILHAAFKKSLMLIWERYRLNHSLLCHQSHHNSLVSVNKLHWIDNLKLFHFQCHIRHCRLGLHFSKYICLFFLNAISVYAVLT